MISSAFRLRRYRVLAFFVVVAIFLFYNSSSISKHKNFSAPVDTWKKKPPQQQQQGKSKNDDAEAFRPPGRASFDEHTDHTSSGDKTVGNVPGGGGIHFVVDEEDGKKPVQRPPPPEDGFDGHGADSKSQSPVGDSDSDPKPKKVDSPTKVQPPTVPELDMTHTHHDDADVADSHVDLSKGFSHEFEQGMHWRKTPEHFPVPKESIISLPRGTPKDLPKVQFAFPEETEKDRKERHRRQGAVKDSFRHAWEGYRKYAWGHDEVLPVSKSYRDPFAGWAATLVDSLDTMAIMGLHQQFTEALGHLEKIDFTTTPKNDIPVFETTIRYLGGLVGAYDVTGHKHPILLRKAVELADVLYNAFDTPNRMPILYFRFRPSEVKEKKRAGPRSVMSELGSLSVEFTRLAQLTGNNSYFDAVQRISDALEEYQMKSSLPGMWPVVLDASGCKEVEETVSIPNPLPAATGSVQNPAAGPKENPDAEGQLVQPLPIPPAATTQPERKPLAGGTVSSEEGVLNPDSKLNKRQMGSHEAAAAANAAASNDESDHDMAGKALKELSEKGSAAQAAAPAVAPVAPAPAAAPPVKPPAKEYVTTTKRVCKDQGLVAPEWTGMDKFSLGGQADSTYEYLVKEYILLGGLREEYKTMYEASFKQFRKHLFFKPLAPKNPDLLVSGQISLNTISQPPTERFIPEGSHLTCFVGGMVALGAKIFNHPEQMDDARRLTEGCVWNYFSTDTGIMPEVFEMHHCKGKEPCEWNENTWLARIYTPPSSAIEAAKARGIKLVNPWVTSFMKRDESTIEKRSPEPGPRNDDQWQEEEVEEDNVTRKTKHRPVAEEEYEYDEQLPREHHSFADDSQDYDEPRRKNKNKNKNKRPKSSTAHGPPRHSAEEEEARGAEKSTSRYSQQESDHEEEEERKTHDSYDEWYIQAKEMVGNMRLVPGYTSIRDTRYILRPEAIESVFYMYRITGDKEWQEKGWRMWEAVEKHTKTDTAHSAINDVTSNVPTQVDEMESFWLAETLKYYYLLFSEPTTISLDEWVLNTEAHPLMRPKAKG